jgi:TRAP transporter TAXI family solute receptor
LATGSTGGTYFPLGGGMANVWTSEIDGLTVSVQASGASVENLRLLQAGEVELIMAVNGVAINALNGAGDFAGEDHDFTAIGNVYGEVTQIVARADADIETIADLAGKRVQIGPAGSGTELSARQILGAHGIDADSDIEAFQDTFGDAADQLRDGTVDAAFGILALPAASIIDVATSTDLVLVNIEGDALDQLLADDPSLSAVEVPVGTYPGQAEVAHWVTNWATLYAAPGLDEDQVYDLVRVLYEGMDPDTVGHAVASEIQLDTAIDGLGGVPLHPGAQRYYEEQGIDVS